MPVLGTRERGGRIKAMPITGTDAKTLRDEIAASIEPGSTLHTDEHRGYRGLSGLGFEHETINHGAGEYVRDGVSTDGIESAWAVLKRGVYRTFHHVSAKHLARYVDEFTFRLTEGDVKRHTMRRFESLVDGTAGRRLSYQDLIG
jgi:transposase-like protein